MKLSTFLYAFLIVDVFFMGALASVALRHAYAHFRPDRHDGEKSRKPYENGHLPPSVREHLLEAAQKNFQQVLNTSADELQKDLADSSERIKELMDKIGNEIVGNEVEFYKQQLQALRKQTTTDITGVQTELTAQQAEMKAKLDADIAVEKQQLVQLIDTKLADAVASFLVDSLQHNVDLGAQAPYLTAVLEEHKAELAKGVSGEA